MPPGVIDRVRDLLITNDTASSFRLLSGRDLDSYLMKLTTNAEFLFWYRSGQIDAFAAYYTNDPSLACAYISMLIVNDSSRGKGVGKGLTQAVISMARTRGFSSVRLQAHQSNVAAIALYQAAGFMIIEKDGELRTMECRL